MYPLHAFVVEQAFFLFLHIKLCCLVTDEIFDCTNLLYLQLFSKFLALLLSQYRLMLSQTSFFIKFYFPIEKGFLNRVSILSGRKLQTQFLLYCLVVSLV